MLRTLALATLFSVLSVAAALKPAPNFTLIDQHGAPIHLSDYQGKVVLLDFWATWCHGCKLEIPWYMDFQNKYKSKGLAVIGVAMDDEGWSKVKPFVAAEKMNYPVVLGNAELSKRYDVNALPVTLLIDREGRIAASHIGLVNKEAFEQQLQSLLGK